MCRFSTKVNVLKNKVFPFSNKPYLFFHQTLVQMQTQGKSNLITLLIMKNAALIILTDILIN